MRPVIVRSSSLLARSKLLTGRRMRYLLVSATILICIGLTAGYTLWKRSPLDLGQNDNMTQSGLYAKWDSGDVVVLIRHAERCDRSSNACLGPEDGITTRGSEVSEQVGKSFRALGLDKVDILSSPTTRTTQTAYYMFGHGAETQEWLSNCEQFKSDEIAASKGANRNLILVTHSGCISQLEKLQGYAHARASAYDSALFLVQDPTGRFSIQGLLNPEDWTRLAISKRH